MGQLEKNVPCISVCIPTYNSERSIYACINSVLAQTEQNFEIIVTDNASEDQTLSVIKSFNDNRIKVFRHPSNLGPHENFNSAIAHANGEYIKTFCSDDIMFPHLLRSQLEILHNYNTVGVVSCHALVKEEGGQSSVWRVSTGYHTGSKILHHCLDTMSNCFGNPSSFMFKRSALVDMKFDSKYQYLSDIDLPARIMTNGWDFYGVENVGFIYIRHLNADTHRTKGHQTRNWLSLMDQFKYFPFESILKITKKTSTEDSDIALVMELIAQKEINFSCYKMHHLLYQLKHNVARSHLRQIISKKYCLKTRLISSFAATVSLGYSKVKCTFNCVWKHIAVQKQTEVG